MLSQLEVFGSQWFSHSPLSRLCRGLSVRRRHSCVFVSFRVVSNIKIKLSGHKVGRPFAESTKLAYILANNKHSDGFVINHRPTIADRCFLLCRAVCPWPRPDKYIDTFHLSDICDYILCVLKNRMFEQAEPSSALELFIYRTCVFVSSCRSRKTTNVCFHSTQAVYLCCDCRSSGSVRE